MKKKSKKKATNQLREQLNRGRRNYKESAVQKDVARWLDQHVGKRIVVKGKQLTIGWFHPPNEGARGIVEGVRLKAEGTKPGVPDILIFQTPPRMLKFKGVAIELKSPDVPLRLREEQSEWARYLISEGWMFGYFNNAKEAIEWLEYLGFGRKD
jgi:hypothetical protein